MLGLTGETDLVTDGARPPHRQWASADGQGHHHGVLGVRGRRDRLAVETDAWLATATALMVFGVAGQVAERVRPGPAVCRRYARRTMRLRGIGRRRGSHVRSARSAALTF